MTSLLDVAVETVATGGVLNSLLRKNLHPSENQMNSPSLLALEVCPCPCSCSHSWWAGVLTVASSSSFPNAAAADMPNTGDYLSAASVDSFVLKSVKQAG